MRSYSLPLQRAMTDFGPDNSFAKAADKVQEYYGVIIPVSGERKITLAHAKKIKNQTDIAIKNKNTRINKKALNSRIGSKVIISQTDGSMVPVVKINKSAKDKRKNKEVVHKEMRLTLAHESGSTTPVFSATFADIKTVGKHIRFCVDSAGCGKNSWVHAIGDGAPWIADQVDNQFGSQATYLLDFYHASEYLAAAAEECAASTNRKWLKAQQQLLKCGKYQMVLNNLKYYATRNQDGAANKCYQYLKKRANQLHYHTAIKNDLPIGSGEIESAHRYIIQHRIKITGAWWLDEHAESMANLGTYRANNKWDNYWKQLNAE